MSNYIHHKAWSEIHYPLPNFNGGTAEVWEWIIILMSHFTGHVIHIAILHGDVIKWKHFRVTGLCAGNSPVIGEFPAQRPVTRSLYVFFDLHRNENWVNNGEAGDLRRHHAHYDVILMSKICPIITARETCLNFLLVIRMSCLTISKTFYL